MSTQPSEFAYWRHTYRHEFGLFCPDLSVSHNDDDYTIYRNVKPFVRQVITRRNADARYVAVCCLQGSAYEWFKSLAEPVQEYVTKDLNTLCDKLVESFVPIEQARLQQQAEEARIAKWRQEVEQARIEKERQEAFACRRCPAKFASNTKLHQHIQDHHQKTKPAKPASEPAISLPNPESTPSEPAKSSPPSAIETFGHFDVKPHKAMSFAERCASYINYPPTQYPPPSQLLSANFTCKQNPDMPGQVYCEACDLQLYGFSTHENPYQKHIDYSPTCPWVLAERAPKTPTTTPTSKAVLTPPATPSQTATKPSPYCPPIATTATPRKQISSAEITSRPMTSPLRLRLPIATPRNVPKVTENASMACPPTPPPTPLRNSASKHQEQKPYLTIHDLFRMFAGKPKRTDLLHTRYPTKKSKSPPKLSNQTKITSYYKPAANQNRPITQDSKSSNPRSFRQRMPAETTRITPSKWSEKSAISPYKTSTFSRLSTSEISSVSPYKMPSISRTTSLTESSKSSAKITSLQTSSISAFPQVSNVCRTCSGTFRSSMGLQHTYDRPISAKSLATAPRTFDGAVALLAPELLGRLAERWDLISLLLVCITIRFLC